MLTAERLLFHEIIPQRLTVTNVPNTQTHTEQVLRNDPWKKKYFCHACHQTCIRIHTLTRLGK